jgi:glutamyl-Q tRNA(Asp) synthetase
MPKISDSTINSYIGRFAPSPSGPLHIGSLITALASFLDARHHAGQWLVRMEDIDPPREEAGAQQSILNSLKAHGLHWDGKVVFQSQRLECYREILQDLQSKTYQCSCARQRLLELHGIYDGHCQNTPVIDKNLMTSTRIALNQLCDEKMFIAEHFQDVMQGPQKQNLKKEVGDFILQRKDGLVAYQLAVVVDDMQQGITHIIRGSDLLSSTPRQRYLQLLLGATGDTLPTYGHIPVATNRTGQKLSKQHKAKGIDDNQAFENLCQALLFLNHPTPDSIRYSNNIDTLLHWAINHWRRASIPQAVSVVVEE